MAEWTMRQRGYPEDQGSRPTTIKGQCSTKKHKLLRVVNMSPGVQQGLSKSRKSRQPLKSARATNWLAEHRAPQETLSPLWANMKNG